MTRVRNLFVAGVLAGGIAVGPAAAQEVPDRLGAIEAYLMDEAAEVALATSAAPSHIAGDAAVRVLRRDGLHEVRAGTNGFTCLVERSWSSPIGLHRDFFNPALRAPICYNAEAARTVLGDYELRTRLALAGKSIADIKQAVDQGIASGALTAPRTLAMSYMLSAGQHLGTAVGRFMPHVMFYVPYATAAALGSNPPGSHHPVMFEHAGGPLAAIVVPVEHWVEVPTTKNTKSIKD